MHLQTILPPPNGFTIASGVDDYPNIDDLFIIGAMAGQDGGDIFAASGGHIHTTSGNHLHNADLHEHIQNTCGVSDSFNSLDGDIAPGRADVSHHYIALVNTSTSGTSQNNIITDISASGLEPAYTKLLGVQTNGTDNIPPGLIFGYIGTSGDLDNDSWEICNGNNDTINLSTTQIKITTDSAKIGDTDASSDYHTHESSHNHEISGIHLHNVLATYKETEIGRNTASPTAITVQPGANGSHTHIWTCTAVSGGLIHNADLITTSGDHRGPWRSMIWVRSKKISASSGYLFIQGQDTTEISGDLFINGLMPTNSGISLYIGGSQKYPSNNLYFNLWSDKQLNSISINNNIITPIASIGFSTNLAINKSKGKIYLTDYDSPPSSVLSNMNLDGTDITPLTSGDYLINPHGLSIDEINGKVYWSNHVGVSQIYNCNLDGSDAQIIIPNSSGLSFVVDLFADPITSKVYWTDIGNNTVSKANLDGTNVEILLQNYNPFSVPKGIYINPHNRTIYFIDEYNNGTLYSCDLDGSNLQVIDVNFTNVPNELTINQVINYAFVTDYSLGNIWQIRLDGTDTQIMASGVPEILDIAIDPPENINLYIQGHNSVLTSGDLFIGGYDIRSNSIDLFIQALDISVSSCNSFIHGHIDSSVSGDLFIGGQIGYDIASGTVPFIITGSGIDQYSVALYLIINGNIPLIPTVCPLPDPTASIQIPTKVIDLYQNRIDALLNQVGKNVILQFDQIASPCINCIFDSIRKRSSGRYKTGGPLPFNYGRKCPYCKGRGVLEEVAELCIRCLISWNPSEVSNFGISVSKGSEIVKLKALIDDASHIKRANIALIDRQVMDLVKYRAKLIKGPYPLGLREDKYCISFWETI